MKTRLVRVNICTCGSTALEIIRVCMGIRSLIYAFADQTAPELRHNHHYTSTNG